MKLLYLIGAVIAFFAVPEVYARIRGWIGYSTNLSEVDEWVRTHVWGGSHKSRLMLRASDSQHCVEFYKWAPRIGFGDNIDPSAFLLIIREGEHCSAEEFTCVRNLLEKKSISCEVERGTETNRRILKADIEPDAELATELTCGLYRDCYGLEDPALRACYRGQVRMPPPQEIMGWTDKLSVKEALRYERNKYKGSTELHPWAERSSSGMAKFMIKNRDGDIDMRNEHGATPLITAGYFGNYDAAEVLLEEGANIRACDRTRRTALHCAAWKGHADVAELLLEHDALTGIKDKEGKTPLDLARENDHEEIVQMLEQKRSERENNMKGADSASAEQT